MADELIRTGGSGQYTKYKLSVPGAEYENIHVFQTKSGQSIAPMVSSTLKQLQAMNPTGISSSKVLAKTNAGMYDAKEKEFYGIYYQKDTFLYIDGKSVGKAPASSDAYTDPRYWPSFCVKTNGKANIRWFTSQAQLQVAMDNCLCIISAVQPLIFDSKNIFEEDVKDGVDNGNKYLLYNKAGEDAPQRFLYVGVPFTNKARTMLGHVADGSYVMVCAKALTLRNGAKVMKKLNCDYAVALDGGSPSQMRVKDLGEVTTGSHDALYTGVCAYTL